jgi:hypothetical protein
MTKRNVQLTQHSIQGNGREMRKVLAKNKIDQQASGNGPDQNDSMTS